MSAGVNFQLHLYSWLRAGEARSTPRLHRLFSCGCVRHVLKVVRTPELVELINLAERVADAEITIERCINYWYGMEAREAGLSSGVDYIRRTFMACYGAACATAPTDDHMSAIYALYYKWLSETTMAVSNAQPYLDNATEYMCGVFEDIRGCPFLPEQLTGYEKDSTVQRLARGIYQQPQTDGFLDAQGLLVLSDALEDAGCTDNTLLGHLRETKPHVKGCWALDLLLGKN